MSTGGFIKSIYRSNFNANNLHPITIQPETLELELGGVTNSAPAGPATSALRAFVSSRKRRGAVNARKIGIEILTPGTSGLEVGSVLYVPWLNPTTFDSRLFPADQEGTYYGGATVRVVGSSPEYARP